MKKFLIGALTATMLMSFGTISEATQIEWENISCRDYDCDNYDNDRHENYRDGRKSPSHDYSGKYCGRHGCEQR